MKNKLTLNERLLIATRETTPLQAQRRLYSMPILTRYGAVSQMTMSNNGSNTDGNNSNPGNMGASDRVLKQNIVPVGIHPCGIGLYLFDYKPEYRDAWGYGRQFGVIADEVEKVMPEAVSVHPDGYKMVDYAMLGIDRNLH